MRFYDPQVGRFTQRDKVRGAPEAAYVYVVDNSTTYVDPSGKLYCHALSHAPWYWCWSGQPPPGSGYKPISGWPAKFIDWLIGKIPGGGNVNTWDSVKSCCQDAVTVGQAYDTCSSAYYNWSQSGSDPNTTDPLMRYMIGLYGPDIAVDPLKFCDVCAKKLTGMCIGDLVNEGIHLSP